MKALKLFRDKDFWFLYALNLAIIICACFVLAFIYEAFAVQNNTGILLGIMESILKFISFFGYMFTWNVNNNPLNLVIGAIALSFFMSALFYHWIKKRRDRKIQ